MKVIAKGAEATVYKTKIINKEVIIKERINKKYRHPILDKKIIKVRNKEEGFLLKKIKEINLNSPYVFYISENKIIMDYIKPEKHRNILKIGEEIAKMHNNDIIHGDLNIINLISNKDRIYFIDFGLGFISKKIEDKATDLLVFKKTLKSLKKTEDLWENIEKGYLKKTNNLKIINQIKEIEKRARYL